MKKLLAVLAIVALTSCGKSKPNVIHVTSPLSYDETKAYLAIYDDAKAEQAIYNKKVEGYVKFVQLMNKAHKYADGSDFKVDELNCHLNKTAEMECERTVVSTPPPPPQATVPPVTIQDNCNDSKSKPKPKETPKK